MHTQAIKLLTASGLTVVLAARIPIIQDCEATAAVPVFASEGQQFLVTDITHSHSDPHPHPLAVFQANFFSNSCNNGFIGRVTGQGGATCVQSIPGTKAVALLTLSRNVKLRSTSTKPAPEVLRCSMLDSAFRRLRLESPLTPLTVRPKIWLMECFTNIVMSNSRTNDLNISGDLVAFSF
ncbi:hypothetical protein K469DRAFT_773655 [Zopfia rhizophila CBS 207.26]|uniref:Uncharacterized protein n=1 Tax=Zopfia rhizophila CBS 207.26 TaxID=1314779 RepID=A0A6A6EQE5_9PEZI|nr:hypothetical protein K469DRAFT_773655 [Zopfia rhizophila CBS 207.26]